MNTERQMQRRRISQIGITKKRRRISRLDNDVESYPFNTMKEKHQGGARLSEEIEDYGNKWCLFNRKAEKHWKWGMPSLDQSLEKQRIEAIYGICDTAIKSGLKLSTVELTYSLWGRVLQQLLLMKRQLDIRILAITAASALRMALKFEERLEIAMELPSSTAQFLSNFQYLNLSCTKELLLDSECGTLQIVDTLDVPSSFAMFDHFLALGGWPQPFARECTKLGHYILALSLFGSGPQHVREKTPASLLAVAALALSVKIMNNGPQFAFSNLGSYEFYPKRLEAYTEYKFEKDVRPVLKKLSDLLRNIPPQAYVLTKLFPNWGNSAWL